MMDFIYECFQTVNLPVSFLLILVMLYWLMAIASGLGTDMFDFDFDTEMDSDLEGDFGGHGILKPAVEFLMLGQIPIAIVGSMLVICMWTLTVLSNHFFNPNSSLLLTGLMMVPIALLSAIGTRLTLQPFVKIFQHRTESFNRETMLGQIGIVKSSEVSCEFGQLEIEHSGPPIVLNVRTKPGTRLRQGDAAKIVSFNNLNDTFIVELSKWEKK